MSAAAVVPYALWGGGQLAALLMSRDILTKMLTYGGRRLYSRCWSARESHPDAQPHPDLDAALARVAALLARVDGDGTAADCSDGSDGSDGSSWQVLDPWEVAVATQRPGRAHVDPRLAGADPVRLAAWQLRDALRDVVDDLGHRRQPASAEAMQLRAAALLELMRGCGGCGVKDDAETLC